MQLSIIIVSYNVKYYLEQCLASVLTACKHITAEVIVIDNASADGSVEYLSEKFPQVFFIKNEVNAGFAKANNKALLLAKGKYILYLNPDTILAEDVLLNCMSFLNDNEQAGAIGVKMLDGTGSFLPESKRSLPSVTASFFKLSGMAGLFPRSAMFNKYALGNLDENTVHAVEVLAGAFMLAGKEILLALNGFDADFFMYGEDIDLSYRIQKAGYTNFFLGNNSIIHFKGESTKNNSVYIKHFYEAMEIFVRKHYAKPSLFFIKPAVRLAALTAAFAQKVRRRNAFTGKQMNNDFILAGDEEAVASAARILQSHDYSYTTITGQLEMIQQALPENLATASSIVFCLHNSGCKHCIQFIEKNRNRFAYYWHYHNTESIVSGSNAVAIPQIYLHK